MMLSSLERDGELTERLYPDWLAESRPGSTPPLYVLVCRTAAEYRVATRLKPTGVRAAISYNAIDLALKELGSVIVGQIAGTEAYERLLTEYDSAGPGRLLEQRLLVTEEVLELLGSIDAEPATELIRDWFVTSNRALGGATPIQALRDDRLSEVLEAARRGFNDLGSLDKRPT